MVLYLFFSPVIERFYVYPALFICPTPNKKLHYNLICRSSYAVVGHVETILMKIHEAQIKRKVRKSVHPVHNTKNMKCT